MRHVANGVNTSDVYPGASVEERKKNVDQWTENSNTVQDNEKNDGRHSGKAIDISNGEEETFVSNNDSINNKSGSTRAKGDTVVASVGTAILSNALGNLFNKITGEKPTGSPGGNNAQIDIPGTIMGNLANVTETRSYMQNFARYNNYLTCNLGLAQMASDRYMSLKERIPMEIEYYLTPTEKKSITMYINPENMSINTTKVKQKVFTRGGIYFHHYGDDVWTLKISGTTGYSQMKGIEALEEVYHHSGTLLKYQNVSVSTVHTNAVSIYNNKPTSLQEAEQQLTSAGGIGGWLGRVITTATDALGYTGDGSNSIGTQLFGKETATGKSNANLFDALSNACLGSCTQINDALSASMGGANGANGNAETVAGLMQAAALVTGNPTAFKEYFNQTFQSIQNGMSGATSKEIIGALSADICTSVLTGQNSNQHTNAIFSQLDNSLKNGFGALTNMLTGNFTGATSYTLPMTGTSGNFYTLGRMTATELNNVVSTVQSFNREHQIDKDSARANWSDIEDQLTDLYRPRQIMIYFDDRVYIGHFDSFNYSRKASTPLIYYDMVFTVTRQVKIDKATAKSRGSATLGELLGTVAAKGIMNGINNISWGKAGSDKKQTSQQPFSPTEDPRDNKG